MPSPLSAFNVAWRFRLGVQLLAALAALVGTVPAWAWGDEGHQVIGLLADRYLEPEVRAKVAAILATDTQGFKLRDGRLTNASFATETNWADYYRESQGHTGPAYQATHLWHYVDTELEDGALESACYHFPALPANTPASAGPAKACVVTKIKQFLRELADPGTPAAERLLALKFVLHFVGDVHQPLHASDDHDAGGNGKTVAAEGFKRGNLHHFWDTEFVARLGPDAEAIAVALADRMTGRQIAEWWSTDPVAWVEDSFAVSKAATYGPLPVLSQGKDNEKAFYALSPAYVSGATAAVALQLSKAGVRLAAVLNETLR